jgi:hypothetical protein
MPFFARVARISATFFGSLTNTKGGSHRIY